MQQWDVNFNSHGSAGVQKHTEVDECLQAANGHGGEYLRKDLFPCHANVEGAGLQRLRLTGSNDKSGIKIIYMKQQGGYVDEL